jgi:oxygen-dependent protoporphyrinogen oxidase
LYDTNIDLSSPFPIDVGGSDRASVIVAPFGEVIMARDVVVVGGGIAGLAIAWELGSSPGLLPDNTRVFVLEAAPRAGGNIRTERLNGYLCEWGPTGFLDDAPATLDACNRLGLGPRLTRAAAAAERRFVVRAGRLRELPSGPLSFLGSDVLSLRGRLRVLGEPFIPARRSQADESVFDFAKRRIGHEAASVLVDALVTGIWAGSADDLSLRSALPKLAALERDHGGLVRGMLAKRGAGGAATGPRGRLTSFPDGLQELPAAFAASLGSRLRLGARVTNIERLPRGGFRVGVDGAAPLEAAAVVLACPSWFAAPLLADLDAPLSAQVAGIPTVAVAVVHLGFAREGATGLAGFGFLIPRGESASVLGVLLPSNIFPRRAPDGHVLATVMLGGARDPAAVEGTDERLVDNAAAMLAKLAEVRAAPRFSIVIRHARAIPQYVLGHADRLATIDTRLRDLPGLFLAGNSYRGIAINSCLTEAPSVAERVAASLRS